MIILLLHTLSLSLSLELPLTLKYRKKKYQIKANIKYPVVVSDLNLLDWSVNNHLAVCLGGHVYLWNAGSGEIQQLMEMDSPDEYISAVSWIKEGNYLALGTSNSDVQVRRIDMFISRLDIVSCLSFCTVRCKYCTVRGT